MSNGAKPWDGALVRRWLESRFEAAKLDQAAADRRGYDAQEDYDKAAAEEWACRTLKTGDCAESQATMAARLKQLIALDEYRATGIHDDVRFERNVRGTLRKIAKMTKTNTGFDNRLRYQ
jgi:hypothetical protein